MTGVALVRPSTAIAWELRGAWARGRRISITIDSHDCQRIEGHVRTVSATGAYAIIAGLHVPLERVLAVHQLGDSTVGDRERWAGRARALRVDPAQQGLLDREAFDA